MSEIRVDGARPDVLVVSGELNFETVPALLERGNALLTQDAVPTCIDLAGVTRADSAGLALLIAWIKTTRRRGRELEFRNIPQQMLAIARLSGLDSILPLGG